MLEKVKAGINKGILSASVNSGTYLEIEKIKGKISNEQRSIEASVVKLGEFVYEKWCQKKLEIEELEVYCQKLAEHHQNIRLFQEEIERLEAEKNRILGKEEAGVVSNSQVVCPTCGALTPSTGKFCLQCGNELKVESIQEERVICTCGNKCKPTDKFCIKCGRALQGGE